MLVTYQYESSMQAGQELTVNKQCGTWKRFVYLE
jgi:hypothetical protein